MKKIDYIAIIFFFAIICLKVWYFIGGSDNLDVPRSLWGFNILSFSSTLAALGATRFRKNIYKIVIPLALIFNIAESLWRFQVGDIGLPFLSFYIISFMIFFTLLYFWARDLVKQSKVKV